MKTNIELRAEISRLKERLAQAVIFEVDENVSVGLSEEDGLWRIRKDEVDGYLFLGKDNLWQAHPSYESFEQFAINTGYTSAEQALDVYEEYTIDYPPSFIPANINTNSAFDNFLKNN